MLLIGDRSEAVSSTQLRLTLRGRPPLALWSMDFEVRAGDARLSTASLLPVPLGPFAGGPAYEAEIPLKDLEGTSFNLKLYVYEHAPVQEARLRLEPRGPGRVWLRLTGRSDLWYGPHERDLPLAVEATLTVSELRVANATGAEDALALVAAAGLPLPESARAIWRWGSWWVLVAGVEAESGR